MDDRDLARLLGLTRVGVGLALLAFPRLSARVWTGEAEPSTTTRLAVRGMGGRDLAIGIGLLTALEKNTPARGWIEAGIVADASDALGGLAASEMPSLRRLLFLGSAAGAAYLGLTLAATIDES